MRLLNFALDFDKTYTEDPDTLDEVLKILRARGHKVYVVSMRYPAPHQEAMEVMEALTNKVDGFFFTSRKAKEPYMRMYQELTPIDIWIDDNPYWLLRDSL